MAAAKSTTMKILSIFFQVSCSIRLFPMKFNSKSFIFEPIQDKTIYFVYLNVFSEFFYLIYLCMSRFVIYHYSINQFSSLSSNGTQTIKTFPNVDGELHNIFIILFGLAAFFNIQTITHRNEIINWLKQFVKFRDVFNGKMLKIHPSPSLKGPSPSTSKVGISEYILRFAIIYTALFTPISFVRMYLKDPLNPRYPIWLLYNKIYSGEWARSIVLLYSIIHLWHAIAYIYILNLEGLLYLSYAISTRQWLKKLNSFSSCELGYASTQSSIQFYRYIFVLNQINSSVFAPTITPIGLLMVIILGISFNYLVLLKMHFLPFPTLMLCVVGALKTFILVVVVPSAAVKTTTASTQFIRSTLNSVKSKFKDSERKYLIAQLKSCRSLGFNVGHFFALKKSTTYKIVFFYILYTMKVLLLLSKKK